MNYGTIESNECNEDIDKNKIQNSLIGGLCAFISAFLLLVNNTLLKKMELNPVMAYLGRSLLQTLVSSFVIGIKQDNFWIWKKDLKQNIVRARILLLLAPTFAAIFNVLDLVAVLFMPIGDAMTLILCSAVPTVFLAAVFLDERLRMYKVICTIMVVSGIVFVIRPPFLFNGSIEREDSKSNNEAQWICSNHYYFGVIAAVICMFSSASFRTIIQLLNKYEITNLTELLLLYHGLWCLAICPLMPLIKSDQLNLFSIKDINHYDWLTWLKILIYSIIGVSNRFLLIKANQKAGSVVVGFIRTSEIILSYTVEIIIFNVIPYLSTIFGGILIMLACIGVLLEDKFLKCIPSKVQPIF